MATQRIMWTENMEARLVKMHRASWMFPPATSHDRYQREKCRQELASDFQSAHMYADCDLKPKPTIYVFTLYGASLALLLARKLLPAFKQIFIDNCR